MQSWMNMNMSNSNSMMMESMVYSMDHMMVIATSVISGTSIYTMLAMKEKFFASKTEDSDLMETCYFMIPGMMLCLLASSSLKMLYTMENMFYTGITIKTTGHQWYWSYEYPENENLEFDSYMEMKNPIRLLIANNHMIMPIMTKTTMLTTSEDVIHSWTVPKMGVKADAVPGRINQTTFTSYRPGVFSGQCSELCGSGHSFMPITISTIPKSKFLSSISSMM